jgi:hypothetical protein
MRRPRPSCFGTASRPGLIAAVEPGRLCWYVRQGISNPGYFLVYFSIISFMTSAAVLLPFRISCIISVDGGRIWFARR